jgi:hypothetical protein
LAFLFNVSGSMSLFAPVLIRFARGMMRRLTEVASGVHDRDAEKGLDKFSLLPNGVGAHG